LILPANSSFVMSVKFSTSKLLPRAVKAFTSGTASWMVFMIAAACLSALTGRLMRTRPLLLAARGSTSATESWSSAMPRTAASARAMGTCVCLYSVIRFGLTWPA
jgi:hypothetical protein